MLNDDVLFQIFRELTPEDGLRAFSLTCRSLRELCKPVLFNRCLRVVPFHVDYHDILAPPSIRPNIMYVAGL